MNSELLYQLALTLVPHIGDAHVKMLINEFGTHDEINLNSGLSSSCCCYAQSRITKSDLSLSGRCYKIIE